MGHIFQNLIFKDQLFDTLRTGAITQRDKQMHKVIIFFIASLLSSALFASNHTPPQALDYLRHPTQVKRIYRTEHPPVATSEANININLNALASIPASAFFDPNDSSSYNYQTDLVIYDSLGANHIFSLYYVKVAVNSWDLYPYVDGIYTGGFPGSLTFTSNGEAYPATGMNGLMFYPATGATSPQVFAVLFNSSTQYANKYWVRSLTQNGSTTNPD